MRRVVVPEMLDADAGTEREIRDSLDDLQRINTLFGGVSSTTGMIRKVARESGSRSLSLLEVASGAGFVPQMAKRRLVNDGFALEVSLLDRARSHLPANGIPTYEGDALALPFPDNSFDLISCGLFLHHLDPAQVLAFARESLRVAKRAVLISDLIRSRVHLALTHIGLSLFRSPITWHDAPASIRAAYTRSEVRAMLAGCGARKVEINSHYLYRMGVILWK
jgi:2-polyprenyl-3-methyl-5-hydroxy-6-metoxy-1,4-benzoquinol methylase